MDNINLDHIQNENVKLFHFFYGKSRPKDKKLPEKSVDPLPFYSAHPSKFWYGSQKCMKLCVLIVATKNSIANQKMDE